MPPRVRSLTGGGGTSGGLDIGLDLSGGASDTYSESGQTSSVTSSSDVLATLWIGASTFTF